MNLRRSGKTSISAGYAGLPTHRAGGSISAGTTIESTRLDAASAHDTPAQVLENLKLTEHGMLKRAALLLFHPDPEKFVTGAFIFELMKEMKKMKGRRTND